MPEHLVYPEVETTPAAVSPAEIGDALQRILASASFGKSRRSSDFLRFIVASSLAGRQDQIKEYLIGVEVFGRSPDYDPKDDPVVRIEAGRLRRKLAEYYGGSGVNDPVIIDVPKGGYVPAFRLRSLENEIQADARRKRPSNLRPPAESQTPQPGPEKRSQALLAVAALALTAIVALASTYFARIRRQSVVAPTSIAVLPFLNLSGATDGQYLTEGVAEELTTGLAELKDLRVVAATSAFQFQGKAGDVRMIGRALNADALLEGSIQQSGHNLRINAQLIDARNGFHLWSKAYDVPGAELAAFEKDVVQETARTLKVPTSGIVRSAKHDTENGEAHDLYLRGRYLWNTRQLPNMRASVQLFERAIADDPGYALAYVGLADAYTVMAVNQQMPAAMAVPPARAAIEQALKLDPNLAQAHATLGLLKSQCLWDRKGAEQEFLRAIELQPNYAEAHHWAGLNYTMMGNFAAAETELREAQILEPLSLMATEGLAENFFFARRYDQTIATVLNMPDRRFGWVILARAYILKGMYQEALKAVEMADPGDVMAFSLKAQILAASGDRSGAAKVLDGLERELRNPLGSQHYMPPTEVAIDHLVLGEKERAFASLEKAYLQHDPTVAQLNIDPRFDPLRSDPRYVALLKQIGSNN